MQDFDQDSCTNIEKMLQSEKEEDVVILLEVR